MARRENTPQPNHENNQENNQDQTNGRVDVPATENGNRYQQEIQDSGLKAKAYEAKLQGSLAEHRAQAAYVKEMRAMYPNWDKFNGVPLSEQNLTPEQRQQYEAVSRELVNGAEQIVNEVVKGPEMVAEVDKALANGAITPEQATQIKAGLQNEQARQQIITNTITWKDKAGNVKDWVVDRAPAFIAGAIAGGAARKAIKIGAIAAFGANLPVAIAAGAVGGGVIEGVKTAWRESKTYRAKDIMQRFYDADDLEKAAMLAKIEQLHAEQRLGMSPEEYEVIGRVLTHERTQMQLSLDSRDGRYANYTDRDKIAYILNITDKNRQDVVTLEDKNRMKESKALIKALNKEINAQHDKSFARLGGKKAVVFKAIFKGAAYGALGGAIGAYVVDFFSGPSSETVSKVVEQKPTVSDSFTKHLDHRGLTGGARDSVHDLIEQQRGVDPNFAKDINVEQLVYAEDTLAKDALKDGVNSGVDNYTWSKEELMSALEKSGAIPDDSTLTEAGQDNISEVIKTKAHFLSEATKEKMLDFDPAQAHTFVEEVVVTKEDGYTYEDYAAIAAALIAVAGSEIVSAADRRKAHEKLQVLYYNFPNIPNQGVNNTPEGVTPDTSDENTDKNGEYVAPTPVFKNSEGNDVPNRRNEDKPIPKPAGSPFAVEDTPIAKPDGEIFDDVEEQETTNEQGEITPESLNDKIKAAGLSAEVKPWPADKATQKQKAKIAKIVDDYIAYASDKKDEVIAGKIVLDFQPEGAKHIDFVDGEIIVEVPLNLPKSKGNYFDGLDEKILELGPASEAAEQETQTIESKKEEKATKGTLNNRLAEAGLNSSVEFVVPGGPTKRDKEKASDLVDMYIESAQKIKGLQIPNKIVLNFRSSPKTDVFIDRDDIILGIGTERSYKPADMEELIDRALVMKTDQLIKQVEFVSGKKVNTGKTKDKKQVSVVDRYKSAVKLLEAYQQNQVKSQESSGSKPIELGPSSIEAELNASNKAPEYKGLEDLQISRDKGYYKIPEAKRKISEELLDNILKTEFTNGINVDTEVVLSNESKIEPGKLTLDMSKVSRNYLSGQVHGGLRRMESGKYDTGAKPDNHVKDYELEEQDKNYSRNAVAEQFSEGAVKELFKEDAELVKFQDSAEDESGFKKWLDQARESLTEELRVDVSGTQKKKIEAYMGKKKETISGLLAMEKLPKITSVLPNRLERYIADKALDQMEEMLNSPEDRTSEVLGLRNKYETFIERLK